MSILRVSVVICVFLHARLLCNGRQVTGSKRDNVAGKDWDRALQLFRRTVIEKFLQGESWNNTAQTNGTATSWLLSIIEKKGSRRSVWDSMTEKINQRVSELYEDENVKNLTSDFNKIIYLMAKTGDANFAQLELDLIRSMSSNFFPQSYKKTNFTVKWFDAMSKYMTILAAGYIDLMKAGIYDDCKLIEQLNMFRPQVLGAAQKLARARYASLEKVGWNGGNDQFRTTTRLSFFDHASGKLFEDIPLTQLQGRLFTPLKEIMADKFMKHFVEKYNTLYNAEWHGSYCPLQPLIQMEELEVEYPNNCMDMDGECILPCGKYNTNESWCMTRLKGNIWESPHHVRYWNKCNPPDWEKCMLVENLQPSTWGDEIKKLTHRRTPDNLLDINTREHLEN